MNEGLAGAAGVEENSAEDVNDGLPVAGWVKENAAEDVHDGLAGSVEPKERVEPSEVVSYVIIDNPPVQAWKTFRVTRTMLKKMMRKM